MFNWAIKRGLIVNSPCRGVGTPSATRERERVLTDPELARVWQAAAAIGFPYGDIVKLMILTGARRDEIAGMCWSELDLAAGVWTLPGARSKNHHPLKLPLPGLAREILGGIPRVAGQDLLFSGSGRAHVTGFTRAKACLEACFAAPIADWRLHDFRRTFASGCAALGVSPHVIEAALNHRTGQIQGIAKVYKLREGSR